MKLYLVIIAFLFCSAPILAFGSDCGKRTSETPPGSSELGFIDGGTIKSLRGQVLLPNGDPGKFFIIELYRNHLTKPVSKITYQEGEEIIKNGRIDARDTDSSNKFCFKNLKPGNYMVTANVNLGGRTLSQYATLYIFVTVNPKIKKNKNRQLEIQLSLAI